jgi:hypothetical protein
MAAEDSDFVALSDAVTALVAAADAAETSAQGFITLTKDDDAASLAAIVDTLPGLLAAADAAVEALEGA